MKLQKQLSRKVGNKEYSKYVVVIPSEFIDKLNWENKDDLNGEVKDKKLIIKKENE